MRTSRRVCATGFSALLALGLVGGGSIAATLAESQQGGITVMDARPAENGTTEMLSYWVTNCEYGIMRVGDEGPSRIALLQQDLRAGLGDQYAQSSITVRRYQIYFNMSKALLQGNPGAGRLGEVLFFAKGCNRLNTRGFYSQDEVTTGHSPLIVEIDTVMDGNTHTVRVVHAPEDEIAPAWNKPRNSTALEAAMHQADIALIDEIKGIGTTSHSDAPGLASGQFRRFDELVPAKTGEQN